MCTLIVLKDMFEDYPLVVASNRDENPQRPSAPPRIWDKDPDIFAPRDLVLGGTWIGINRHGLFGALTNLDKTPHCKGLESRGQLLARALRHESVRKAAWLTDTLVERAVGYFSPPPRYNDFNLVLADNQECSLTVYSAGRFVVRHLGAGAHVITGYGNGPNHAPRASEITRRLNNIKSPTPEELDTLLNFHADGTPEAAACVHDPDEYHKTVSSMIVRADRGWSRFETWFREGPACSGPFRKRIDIPIGQQRRSS